MMNKILITLFILIGFIKVNADTNSYSFSFTIETESKNYKLIHFHDWTDSTKDSRWKMISSHQDPFTSENDYSYLECIDKKTGKTIFKKPCPALTKIQISEDERYFIGISKIMLWNPYQLVIFDRTGNLVKKRHISSEEAKLSTDSFRAFKTTYTKQFQYLDSLERIYKIDEFYFIDFMSMDMPKRLGEAWDYLIKFYTDNHLSTNISQSVTNWVFWYYEESPEIKFNYQDFELVSVSILDPKKQRIIIKIIE